MHRSIYLYQTDHICLSICQSVSKLSHSFIKTEIILGNFFIFYISIFFDCLPFISFFLSFFVRAKVLLHIINNFMSLNPINNLNLSFLCAQTNFRLSLSIYMYIHLAYFSIHVSADD